MVMHHVNVCVCFAARFVGHGVPYEVDSGMDSGTDVTLDNFKMFIDDFL